MGERILVVDDDERLGAVLRDGLSHHGFAVEVAGDGQMALECARARPPDLVVLDLLLPGMDGLAVCRQLRAVGGPPIIMLTARDAVGEKVAGLESGADDYLTKPFVLAKLVARIRAVLRRRSAPSPALQRVADIRIDARGHRAWRGDRLLDLTAREFELLDCLVGHAGQVLTHELLLERVWGYNAEIESNAVKVYVAYLRAKLNAAGDPDLIESVRGVGYVLRG